MEGFERYVGGRRRERGKENRWLEEGGEENVRSVLCPSLKYFKYSELGKQGREKDRERDG